MISNIWRVFTMLVWLKLYTPCCISLKIFSCKISWLLIWTPNKFNTQKFFSCLWRGMPPSSALHVVVPWRPDVLTLESHEEMLILHIKPRFGVLNWPKEGPLRDHQLQTCGQNFSLNHTHTTLRYLSHPWKCFKIHHFFWLTLSLEGPFFSAWSAVAANTTWPLVPPKPKELTEAQGNELLGP